MNRIPASLIALVAAIGLLQPMPAWAQETDLTGKLMLQASVNPEDPFDKGAARDNTTKWKARRGQVVRIEVSGTPLGEWYTYPISQKTNDQPALTRWTIEPNPAIMPLGPVIESPASLYKNKLSKIDYYTFHGPFTWQQEILVAENAPVGVVTISVKLDSQVCDKDNCVLVRQTISIPLEISDEAPLAIPPALAEKAKNAAKIPDKDSAPPPPTVDANNLWSFLWFASLSAFLMLLTPCVFPMIPITVNFFLKQSEKEHHNPLAMASVYSGTIIILLTAIMLVLGKFVIDLANNEWFNVALGLMLIIFALSLFGMYELELPHFLSRYTSSHEGQGGLIGAMFMAMTFTITSFTCTGPFLGLMLGSVAGVKPPMVNLVLGAVVYSTTFAAPFFVLALFPSLLKKLPRSGSWLNSVKVTMGFLELGAALKFLSNADLAFFPGNPQLFNYDTVLAAWIALSVSCSLYLLGLFRLPNDDKIETIGVIRMMIAVGFLGLSAYLAPAMFGLKPAGVIGDNAIAFLPIRTGHDNDGAGVGGNGNQGGGHKDWYLDYEDAWKDAVANDKLIFIDFTGQTCVNCRYNEGTVFPMPQVKAEMEKMVKVSLYTDSVPSTKLSAADSKKQGDRNAAWQDALADKNPALPTYIILRPARDSAFENGIPKGTIVGKANGAIQDVPAFVSVLRNAQAKAVAQLRP